MRIHLSSFGRIKLFKESIKYLFYKRESSETLKLEKIAIDGWKLDSFIIINPG